MAADQVRTILLYGVLLSFGLVPAVAAIAAESNPQPAATAAVASIAEEDPKVCKRFMPTGSRIMKRYCLPRSQWEAMRTDGQRAARDAIRQGSQVRYKPPG